MSHLQARNRDTDVDDGLVDKKGKERVRRTEKVALTYILSCVKRLVGSCYITQGAQSGAGAM